MGMQEYLVKVDNHNYKKLFDAFKNDITCIAIPKKILPQVATICNSIHKINTDESYAVLFGDRAEIRHILLSDFIDTASFYSEVVNVAATGQWFPNKEEMAEYFAHMSVDEFLQKTEDNTIT